MQLDLDTLDLSRIDEILNIYSSIVIFLQKYFEVLIRDNLCKCVIRL